MFWASVCEDAEPSVVIIAGQYLTQNALWQRHWSKKNVAFSSMFLTLEPPCAQFSSHRLFGEPTRIATAAFSPGGFQTVCDYICMPIYHCDFLCVLALFSPLGHGFCSFLFVEHLKRTRRCITRRDRGSSDNRGASYRHRKPQKLALFCGVPIPEKLDQAFAFFCFAEYFVRDRPCAVCCKHAGNSDARSALHRSSATTKKTANEQSATSGVHHPVCLPL